MSKSLESSIDPNMSHSVSSVDLLPPSLSNTRAVNLYKAPANTINGTHTKITLATLSKRVGMSLPPNVGSPSAETMLVKLKMRLS